MTEQTITLTKQDIDNMPPEELNSLLLRASKVQATCVVTRPDGSIKYDEPSRAGEYGEEHLEPQK